MKDLDASAFAQQLDLGIDPAWLMAPMRGSYGYEVARCELAGRPVWLSVSVVGTGKRRMEFRALDQALSNEACPQVLASVLYVDRGDCTATLGYDAVGVEGKRPPGDESADTFKIGNTGLVKRHDFKITDARLDSKRQSALWLFTGKDVDFALGGMFLRKDPAL
jgi:hypothetical protein